MLSHNFTWLLNTAPVNLIENGKYYNFLRNIVSTKSVMGLWQDQVFENCKKWMQAYKEWGIDLDKCLYSLSDLKENESANLFYKIGV